MGDLHLQVDAGPDFRRQCLDNDIRRVDHFFLTHGHADHIMGMDDLRRFCTLNGSTALPVYSSPSGLGRVAPAVDTDGSAHPVTSWRSPAVAENCEPGVDCEMAAGNLIPTLDPTTERGQRILALDSAQHALEALGEAMDHHDRGAVGRAVLDDMDAVARRHDAAMGELVHGRSL